MFGAVGPQAAPPGPFCQAHPPRQSVPPRPGNPTPQALLSDRGRGCSGDAGTSEWPGALDRAPIWPWAGHSPGERYSATRLAQWLFGPRRVTCLWPPVLAVNGHQSARSARRTEQNPGPSKQDGVTPLRGRAVPAGGHPCQARDPAIPPPRSSAQLSPRSLPWDRWGGDMGVGVHH